MASQDIGKKFEDRFKKDYQRCFPNTLIYRLPDQQSGYAGGGSTNPCDFICYSGDCVLMVECKAHKGSSIPFTAIPQYERMLSYKGTYKTYPGVIIWFYEKDTVIWVSIEEMEKMVLDGERSIVKVVILLQMQNGAVVVAENHLYLLRLLNEDVGWNRKISVAIG